MVRVGVPETIGEEWLHLFPVEAEIVRLPGVPEAGTEVEFLVSPLYPKQLKSIYPQLAGVKVVQALLAGGDLARHFLRERPVAFFQYVSGGRS